VERVKGIEALADNSQAAENQQTPEGDERAYTQIRAQIGGNDRRDLSQVVNAWPRLSGPLKAAILAIVTTGTKMEGE